MASSTSLWDHDVWSEVSSSGWACGSESATERGFFKVPSNIYQMPLDMAAEASGPILGARRTFKSEMDLSYDCRSHSEASQPPSSLVPFPAHKMTPAPRNSQIQLLSSTSHPSSRSSSSAAGHVSNTLIPWLFSPQVSPRCIFFTFI